VCVNVCVCVCVCVCMRVFWICCGAALVLGAGVRMCFYVNECVYVCLGGWVGGQVGGWMCVCV